VRFKALFHQSLISFCVSLVLIALSWAAGLGLETGPFTLSIGDSLDRVRLTALETHSEYMRATFSTERGEQRVEIAARRGVADEWSTRYYRVQPVPDSPPDLLLFRQVLAALKHEENRFTHRVFVWSHQRPPAFIVRHSHEVWNNLVWIALLITSMLFVGTAGYLMRRHYTRTGMRFGARRLLFWTIALGPLFVLVLVVTAFAVRVAQINRFNGDELAGEVQAILAADEGVPFEFFIEHGEEGYLTMENEVLRFVAFGLDPNRRQVYTFGGSSLTKPVFEEAFPALLDARLDALGVDVHNFGCPGLSSFPVSQRVEKALNRHTPALIVIYTGHNDYSRVWQGQVLGRYALFKGVPLLGALVKTINSGLLILRGEGADFSDSIFFYSDLEPRAVSMLARLGLIDLDVEVFLPVRRVIAARYEQNLRTMLAAAKRHNVPVILATVTGNLERKPYGPQAEKLFAQAQSETDYATRIKLLMAARDADCFNVMMRAKSDLNDVLRRLADDDPNVTLYDLEAELVKSRFSFSFSDYYDEVHFKPATHERIADMLAGLIIPRLQTPPSGEDGDSGSESALLP
jgi:lysophospholipase L1-like esterase